MCTATMNTKGAATYLGISLRMLGRLMQRGEIPIVRLGRRVVLRKASLDEFLRTQEQRRGRDE